MISVNINKFTFTQIRKNHQCNIYKVIHPIIFNFHEFFYLIIMKIFLLKYKIKGQ